MSMAAFRSTTRRSVGSGADSIEDAGSSNRDTARRRSRSLSRYSGLFAPPMPDPDEFQTPRGRFVNRVRCSEFPEISLDDLAEEFFRARAESDEESEPTAAARSGDRSSSGARYRMETEASRRRGRSVSRPPGRRTGPGKGDVSDSTSSSRRRRSFSVSRHRCTDSENDIHASSIQVKSSTFANGKLQQSSLQKAANTCNDLRRSMSQKDFVHSNDSYSSHSFSLTDGEIREFRVSKCGFEKTIQAVYFQEKAEIPIGDEEGIGLYEALRKEVRHAIEEIRTHLERVMVKTEPTVIVSGDDVQPKSSEVLQAIAEIRRNYTAKLEQSEERRQDLLAQLAVEEVHGQELSKIVKELLPSPKKNAAPERQARPRRRSNDRTRISKRLTEEAEKYFEDFLSNVEDTDISSFDGERSDTNSSIRECGLHTPENVVKAVPLPIDTDGVLLPWLQWETSNDLSLPCKTQTEHLLASKERAGIGNADQTASSLGSWSPVFSRDINESKFGIGTLLSSYSVSKLRACSFDAEEYLSLQKNGELLFERLRQRQRIESGSMILCGRTWI